MNFALLKHPFSALLGIVVGILIGFFLKPVVPYLAPFGETYLSLLNMCILPIMTSSIVYGLAHLIRSRHPRDLFTRMLIVFMAGFVLTSAVAITVIVYGGNFIQLDTQTIHHLGQSIPAIEYYPSVIKAAKQLIAPAFRLAAFLQFITPENIFQELSGAISLKLILVTLLVGIALGKTKIKSSLVVLDFFKIINQIFYRIFDWLLYFLPFGLCCLIVDKVGLLNPDLLGSLIKLIALIYIGACFLLILATAITSFLQKKKLKDLIIDFKKPAIIAFVMSSTFIALPSAIETLEQSRLKKDIIDLSFPLGISINRVGTIFLLATISVFIAKMYQVHLGIHNLLLIFFLAIVAGATMRGRGTLLQPAFNMISLGVGLPLAPAILILTILDPFVTRVTTLITVYINCLQSLIIAKHPSSKIHHRADIHVEK